MAKQIIDNLDPGTLDGDSLFQAAEKINANFTEIYNTLGDGNTISAGGISGVGAGILIKSGDSFIGRELTSNTPTIVISNGNGGAGNPTIDLLATGVVAGTYSNHGFTVSAQGILTSVFDPDFLTNAQSAETNATASATAAATSATNAAASATSAASDVATIGTSLSDAQTAATNAASSATTATNAATTATTQATNASTSATNAATSETNAATSETNASTSASTASSAATTATNAANSIGTSVSDAQTAATNAANSYDSFDDRYLGAKTSAPSVDNDGDALITGALYFNSTSDKMFVRTSSGGWTAAGSAVNGTTNRNSYTATANQTSFASVYDVGYVDVYLNGLKLMPADFTATDGANIVLASGAAAGDTVDIIGYGAFSLSNFYTKTESDGRYYLKATADSNFLDAALNLSDLANAATARTNLGLHAVASSGDYNDLTNTPSSTAPLNSPAFTGTPTVNGSAILTQATAPAGGNNVQLTASGTLANGDPVILNANGTVSAVTGTQGGAAGLTTYTSSNVGINSGVFHVGQNAVVIAYSDNTNNGAGYVVAGTVNASTNTFTFGTPVQFESDNVANLDICYDSGSQLVHIAFTETGNGYPNIRAYSLSGTTLTAATSATTVNGTNSAAHIRITYDAYYDQLVVGFRDISSSNYARARAFNYNAGAYTKGSIITMQSSLSYSNQQAYDPVNYKHVHVCAGNNGWPHAYTLTVGGTGAYPSLSTSPAAQLFGNAISYYALEYYPATQNMVFVYQLNSNSTGYVSIGIYNSNLGRWDAWTATGNSYIISQGGGFSGQISNSANTRYGYDEDNQELMVTFGAGSTDSVAVAVKVDSNGAITTRGPQQFDTFANYYHGTVYDTSQNVTVATFHDQGNSNKGSTAIIRFDSTNLTASNFIGFSAGAVTDGNTATVQTTGNVADNVSVPLAFLYQSSFSLSAQSITTPEEIRFKPDGTKFYILGGTNDIVYQYAMSTAWDISTASYENKNVSVQTQEATPQGLSLNADGTSIYVCGQSKSVYQYDLSSAYDVSTASYANKSFSFATQMPSSVPWGIDFNTDGTSMFAIGAGGSVFQYTLSTGFDVSTASYASKTFATGLANPSALNFTSDGATLYVYNYGDGIYKFTLSTPFDLATMSNANINYSTTAQGSQGYGVAVKPDGTQLYVTEMGNLSAYQYSLTTDLLIGTDYFVRIDGTLNTTADANYNVPAGKALSATKLLIA